MIGHEIEPQIQRKMWTVNLGLSPPLFQLLLQLHGSIVKWILNVLFSLSFSHYKPVQSIGILNMSTSFVRKLNKNMLAQNKRISETWKLSL